MDPITASGSVVLQKRPSLGIPLLAGYYESSVRSPGINPRDRGHPSANERGTTFACDNGIDDDGNGLIDFPYDDGCSGPTDELEDPPPPVATGLLGAGVPTLFALALTANAPVNPIPGPFHE